MRASAVSKCGLKVRANCFPGLSMGHSYLQLQPWGPEGERVFGGFCVHCTLRQVDPGPGSLLLGNAGDFSVSWLNMS